IQDVCLQDLPVVFAVDRAGLVGEDGPTHHGNFDLTYLTMIPRMVVMAPSDEEELKLMLEFALTDNFGPIAIRYPRGSSPGGIPRGPKIELGKARVLRVGKDGCVLAIGYGTHQSVAAAQLLSAQGIELTVVDARFAKPLDEQLYLNLAERHGSIVTVEENTLLGGFGAAVSLLVERFPKRPRLRCLGLPDRFVEHGSRETLLEEVTLSASRLAEEFRQFFSESRR
ncbi:MAG: transketolase C-terminal domain-containing protein, partial [candidate division WOR-3 bacterium]